MTRHPLRAITQIVAVLALTLATGYAGVTLGRQYERNRLCCQVPSRRAVALSIKEILGLIAFPSQSGQDKWVSEAVFPDVTNGFFLDVGSGDGTELSNTKALERKGWTGICVDPFPRNMQDRTCQMFREVVSSVAGKTVSFRAAGDLGGIASDRAPARAQIEGAPRVDLTTVTLGDILARAKAPSFIHFVSLDIEGGELNALLGFPFDKYTIGAMAVEHNYDEPKRAAIEALMNSHGYTRVHSWYQDDYYVPAHPN